MKVIALYLILCWSVLADEGEIRVYSIAHTNAADVASTKDIVYTKDEFTRDGQTNLIRILKVRPEGWAKICHFYHGGHLVGNFTVMSGQTRFNTEPGAYCMSLTFGPAGEILAAYIGDSRGVPLDRFTFTNDNFSPVPGPLRWTQAMKPLFYDEAKFIKEAAEAEARLKSKSSGQDGPTSR
jgi:hypothetical protein